MRKFSLKLSVFTLVLISLVAAGLFAQRARLGQMDIPSLPKPQTGYHKNPSALKVARLHYGGGGDWYWGTSAIPNLLKYTRENTPFVIDTIERQVEIMDADLFQYPFLFATGHGTISFNAEERQRLRTYLAAGGFLFINDSYGMEATAKESLKALFPERELVEVPFDHPLYHCFSDFSSGPPKIHEHDGKPPRGYGVIIDGRVAVYLLVESDIGDGWEDPQVHNDPPEKRQLALQMGVNLLTYALLY